MKKALLILTIVLGTNSYAQQIIEPEEGDIFILQDKIYWKYNSNRALEEDHLSNLTYHQERHIGKMYLSGDTTTTFVVKAPESHLMVITYHINGSASFHFRPNPVYLPWPGYTNPYPISKTVHFTKEEMTKLAELVERY